MPSMNFGRDQLAAIEKTTNWYNTAELFRKPIFVIGGYAGTGKSTVLRQVLTNMGIPLYKIAYVTYTGKAAVVLRQKGLPAYTIHRLIYNVSTSSTTGKPLFRKKPRLPSNIELICIDELGMVPQPILEDIISYGIPILGLGDPGQLPPVFGENAYISNPDTFLTEVFRQSGDSDLLTLATDIRNGIDVYNKKYASDVSIFGPGNSFDYNRMVEFDQILCSRNANKMMINVNYRDMLKINTPLPIAGEKVICGMNNFGESYSYGDVDVCLVNGLTGITTTDAIEVDNNVVYFKFQPDKMNMQIPVYAKKQTFLDNYEDFSDKSYVEDVQQQFHMELYDGKPVNVFDYAYAITTHKSQGSEWDNVLVFDDCFYHDAKNYGRWLYTSVTRAKKKVTIVKMDA